jgi:hypothetical protein
MRVQKVIINGFGRRNADTIRALRRPASEKRKTQNPGRRMTDGAVGFIRRTFEFRLRHPRMSRHSQGLHRRRRRIGKENRINPLHNISRHFKEVSFVFQRHDRHARRRIGNMPGPRSDKP